MKTEDVLYGEIRLSALAKAIIDTPLFQRMRNIKQLSFVYLVYASANHPRFEHLLGSYHRTRLWVNHLLDLYPKCISPETAEMICIGALVHDLGHGPFSHTFDRVTETKHEARSVRALQELVKRHPDVHLSQHDVAFIENVIYGTYMEGYPNWCFELVCNKTTSVDSDKFDYLSRDMHYCHIARNPQIERIIGYSRINMQGHICFAQDARLVIENLFLERYFMFREVYLHKVVVAVQEAFLIPMLQRMSKVLRWKERLQENWYATWLALDDHVMHEIPITDDALLRKPVAELSDWCYIQQMWYFVSTRQFPHRKFVTGLVAPSELNSWIVKIELDLANGKSSPLDTILWDGATEAEETKQETRIRPSKYQEIRYLQLRLKSPIYKHYSTDCARSWHEIPNDACIHNIYDCLQRAPRKEYCTVHYSDSVSLSDFELARASEGLWMEHSVFLFRHYPTIDEANDYSIWTFPFPEWINALVAEKRMFILHGCLRSARPAL